MTFLITGYDAADEGAYDRRMAVRPKHLENIEKYNKNGNVLCGGGITDEGGKLIGSFLVMKFETRNELDKYLESEPYMTGNIWKDVRIDTCNIMVGNG